MAYQFITDQFQQWFGRKFITLQLTVMFVGMLLVAPGMVRAADENLVGVLSNAIKPAVAEQLGLSESQLLELEKVVKTRTMGGIGLSRELREMPLELRQAKRREYVRETERMGMAILDLGQRSRLERIRLAQVGLISLAEPQTVETLGLSVGQQKQVEEILNNEARLIQDLGTEKAKVELEKRLSEVVTKAQYVTWKAMAGMNAGAVDSPVAAGTTQDSSSKVMAADEQSVLRDLQKEIDAETAYAQEMSPEDAADLKKMLSEMDADADVMGLSAVQVGGAQSPAGQANVGQDSANQDSNVGQGNAGSQNSPPTGMVAIDSTPSQSSMRGKGLSQKDGADGLMFNFDSVPWREVLVWLSEQAELSLQMDTIPSGSFTYRDPFRKYSVAEAMDVMNGVLLGNGYTLIRRQRVLLVVDLGSGESADVTRALVRELAQLVQADELDGRGEFELLKCLFVLSRISPEQAAEQVNLMVGPQGSVIALDAAGQILVTETAGNLRLIRDMIQRSEDPDSSRGSTIVSIPLKNVTAEEVLGVARPLLGLDEETNGTEDFKVSTDAFGNVLYATGNAETLQKFRDLAEQIDVPPGGETASAIEIENPEIQTHAVTTSDPETTLAVLQTLLANVPGARLALDERTNNLVAFATPKDHQMIEETLNRLAGEGQTREIIDLDTLDPQATLLTVEKMFGAPEPAEGEPPVKNAIKFFADTTARTLLVQGNKRQIEEVRDFLGDLRESNSGSMLLSDTVRFLPMSSRSADRVLTQAELLWRAGNRKNRIRVVVPTNAAGFELPQMTADGKSMDEQMPPKEISTPAPLGSNKRPSSSNAAAAATLDDGADARRQSKERFVFFQNGNRRSSNGQKTTEDDFADAAGFDASDDANELELSGMESVAIGNEIVIYKSNNGLFITSEDKQALADFEQLMRMTSEQMNIGSGEPSVFYLKYVRASAAMELLNSILSGESSSGGSDGGLLGDVTDTILDEVTGGFGGFGGLGGGGSGAGSGLANGDYSITADPRTNSLFVKATPQDFDLISQLLTVIDRENSPLIVETRGQPRLIPIVNMDVAEVESIVKTLYANRIAGANKGGGGGQPSPQEIAQLIRGGGGGANGGPSELKENEIMIASDARSNSLVVTATRQDFEEIRDLVEQIDVANKASEEEIQVVPIGGNVNPAVVKDALQSILGEKAQINDDEASSTGSSATSSNRPTSNRQFDANALRRQIQAFQFQRGGGQRGGGQRGGAQRGGGQPQRGGGQRGGNAGGRGR